jgi:murein DD-endopeptidase MepM/ murein hydrolase activator NlpD
MVLASCLAPPVDAPVIDPYRPPICRWCPGNRGVDYGTAPGVSVRSVVPGTVTFAGRVGTTAYVVVTIADGRRLTYGGLEQASVKVGERVTIGQTVGITAGPLHFGVRRGELYEDPAVLLQGRPRARLVRVDGQRRPASGNIACGLAPARSFTKKKSRIHPAVAVRPDPR